MTLSRGSVIILQLFLEIEKELVIFDSTVDHRPSLAAFRERFLDYVRVDGKDIKTLLDVYLL